MTVDLREAWSTTPAPATERERAAIEARVRDYFEGWFDGDAARMARALHPELAKRCFGQTADRAPVLLTDRRARDDRGDRRRRWPGARWRAAAQDRDRRCRRRDRQRRRPLRALSRIPAPRGNAGRLADRQRAVALVQWSRSARLTPLGPGTAGAIPCPLPGSDRHRRANGVRLFYEVYGTGEPTVLLMPTWSIIHSRQWKLQIPYLARLCRVVTFDGRGNGRSDRPSDPVTIRRGGVRSRTRSPSWTRPRTERAVSSCRCRGGRNGHCILPPTIPSA